MKTCFSETSAGMIPKESEGDPVLPACGELAVAANEGNSIWKNDWEGGTFIEKGIDTDSQPASCELSREEVPSFRVNPWLKAEGPWRPEIQQTAPQAARGRLHAFRLESGNRVLLGEVNGNSSLRVCLGSGALQGCVIEFQQNAGQVEAKILSSGQVTEKAVQEVIREVTRRLKSEGKAAKAVSGQGNEILDKRYGNSARKQNKPKR